MSLLIKSEQEFQRVMMTGISTDFESIEPQIDQAEQDLILPVIGTDLLTTLKAKIEDSDVIKGTVFEDLLVHVQKAIAPKAYLDSLPFLDINLKPGGFTVNTDEKSAPAAKWRVRQVREALMIQSQKSLDSLIAFLDANRDTLDDYKDSEAEQNRWSNFVNTGAEWAKAVHYHANNWVIDSLRASMNIVEEEIIRPLLCDDLFNHMKSTIKNRGDLTVYAPLLPMIQSIVANATMARVSVLTSFMINGSGVYLNWDSDDDHQNQTTSSSKADRLQLVTFYENTADKQRERLRTYLKANAASLPLFNNSPCNQTPTSQTVTAPTNGIFPAFGVR